MPTLTREERAARVEALETWIRQQNEAYEDEALPDEVRAQWDTNNAELDEHHRVMRDIEAREARVRLLAARGGDDTREQEPRPRLSGSGPTLISRMSETEVHDLNSIRISPVNPELGRRELRDRAMRSVELSSYPHERARKDDVVRHLQRLLDEHDSPDKELARRILVTGSPTYRSAFGRYLLGQPRSPEEERALALGSGATGGFAIVYQLDPTVIPTSNWSINPMRAIGNVETIVGTNEWRGVTSAGVTASRVAEATAATDGAPTLAQPALIVTKVHVFVPFSIEIGQDWAGLQAAMARLFSDAKDDEEATSFLVGNGTTPNPSGLITGATNTVTAGGSAAFAIADLYKLWEALPPRFRPRANWVANLFTYDKIRQFDTAGGSGVWLPGLAGLFYGIQGPAGGINQGSGVGNTGATLLGKPSFEATAMAAALTTGSKIAAVGDMSYFKIVDRIGMDVEVIPFLFGAAQGNLPTGQRGLYAYWRNYARLLDPNAVRVLVTG